MITGGDIYEVLSALVPLYVAMILAYGSVRWWKIFAPDQCSGINRFVVVFAVPLLSFHFISTNNPYAMNFRFIAADSLQKVVILIVLFLWNFTRFGSLDCSITFFSLSALPNTLVMGVPLLRAMYGDFSARLMVQIVVLQSVVWNTLLMFLFEYRGAKALFSERFPPDVAKSISTVEVESDVVSLSSKEEALQANAEMGKDGRLRVIVRRSDSSSRSMASQSLISVDSMSSREPHLMDMEIYSLPSSREATPRALSFKDANFYPMSSRKVSYLKAGHNHSLNKSNEMKSGKLGGPGIRSNEFVNRGMNSSPISSNLIPNPTISGLVTDPKKEAGANGDLHMFVWSTSSPTVPKRDLRHAGGITSANDIFSEVALKTEDCWFKRLLGTHASSHNASSMGKSGPGTNGKLGVEDELKRSNLKLSKSETPLLPLSNTAETGGGEQGNGSHSMPPATVITRLIIIMVWRKLIRNPNTYGSIIGLVWSLISFRWNVGLPKIIDGSITILSNTGLGMAMFSLGLFMALQPKLITCGKTMALSSMAVRFLVGPIVMAVTSIAIGLRGDLLRVSILQAALPQGIIPFVFAKEYACHAGILSTGVIFGMVVALPITIIYYILLGLKV